MFIKGLLFVPLIVIGQDERFRLEFVPHGEMEAATELRITFSMHGKV